MFNSILTPLTIEVKDLLKTSIIGVDILIDNVYLDLDHFHLKELEQYVNSKKGIFNASCLCTKEDFTFKLYLKTLFNLKNRDTFSINLTIIPSSNYSGNIHFIPYLTKDILKETPPGFDNPSIVSKDISSKGAYMCFINNESVLTYAMKCEVYEGDFKKTSFNTENSDPSRLAYSLKTKSLAGTPVMLNKYCSLINGSIGSEDSLNKKALELVKKSCIKGFDNIKRGW